MYVRRALLSERDLLASTDCAIIEDPHLTDATFIQSFLAFSEDVVIGYLELSEASHDLSEVDGFSIVCMRVRNDHLCSVSELLRLVFAEIADVEYLVVRQPKCCLLSSLLDDFSVLKGYMVLHKNSLEEFELVREEAVDCLSLTIRVGVKEMLKLHIIPFDSAGFDIEEWGKEFLLLENVWVHLGGDSLLRRAFGEILKHGAWDGFVWLGQSRIPAIDNLFLPLKRRIQLLVKKEPESNGFVFAGNRENLKKFPVIQPTNSYAMICTKWMLVQRPFSFARLLIIGESETGLGAVEGFFSNCFINFSQITLISPGGEKSRRSWGSVEERISRKEGRVVSLDRNGCSVRVLLDCGNEEIVEYDFLIITTGLQDNTLHSVGVRSIGLPLSGSNLRHINGAFSSFEISKRLQGSLLRALIYNPLARVVVFGKQIQGLSVVNELLEKGIPLDKIILITSGNDQTSLSWLLSRLPIEIYDNFEIVQVKENIDNKVRSVEFKDKEDNLFQFRARVLITCDTEGIDADIFEMVNSSGLVWDGGIVVNNNFQTSDQRIFAGGRCARFSRRLNLPISSHANLNGREIGLLMAKSIIEQIQQNQINTVHNFKQPLISYFRLPLGYSYTKVTAVSIPENLKFIDTNNLASNGKYCKLGFDENGIVCVAECVQEIKNELPRLFFAKIIGMSDKGLLQTIRDRINKVSCIAEYLTASGSAALFHDKGDDLIEYLVNNQHLNQLPIHQVLVKFIKKHSDELPNYFIPYDTI